MAQIYALEQGFLHVEEQGSQAKLDFTRVDDKKGLYKAWIHGPYGKMELGAMLPEGEQLHLCRTVSLQRLRQAGCWPIIGGTIVLSHPFGEQSLPPGWIEAENLQSLFPKDKVLQHCACQIKACLWRKSPEGFRLALAFDTHAPFVFSPAFCFAIVEKIGNRYYALIAFNHEGKPLFP